MLICISWKAKHRRLRKQTVCLVLNTKQELTSSLPHSCPGVTPQGTAIKMGSLGDAPPLLGITGSLWEMGESSGLVLWHASTCSILCSRHLISISGRPTGLKCLGPSRPAHNHASHRSFPCLRHRIRSPVAMFVHFEQSRLNPKAKWSSEAGSTQSLGTEENLIWL